MSDPHPGGLPMASGLLRIGGWLGTGGGLGEGNLVPASNGTSNSRSFSLLPSHYCVPAVLS